MLRGDFGTSLTVRRPVVDVIGERLPNTLLLMIAAEVFIILGALLIGIYSALHQYSAWDNIITTVTFIFYSMPIFFIALISMYIFAVLFKQWGLPYLPTVGMFDPKVGKTAGQVVLHMVLPVLSIALISFAAYSRYIRSTMLEVMSQDYIRTARSKGLPRRGYHLYPRIKERFACRSSPWSAWICPSCWAERWSPSASLPGRAWGACSSTRLGRADTPVVMGILMMIAVAVIVFQIITDIVYAWLDPRIRYGLNRDCHDYRQPPRLLPSPINPG